MHVLSCDRDRVEAARRADRAVQYLESHQVTVQAHIGSSDASVADQILTHAQQLDAGLVAMGGYSSRPLHAWLFGSATRQLLQECPLPLFMDR